MLKRILTALIGAPILFYFVYLGGLPLKAVTFLLIVIGMSELYKAMSNNKLTVHYVGYIFAAIYMYFTDFLTDYAIIMAILILFVITVLSALVILHRKITIMDCAVTIFGFYYVALLMSTIYLVRESQHGIYFIWIVFITAFGTDTGAMLTGKYFGKTKLIPSLSPYKTVAGAIGGTVVSTVLSLVYGIFLSKIMKVDDIAIISSCTIVGVCGAAFSQFGDLTASAIKRHTGVKDFGKLLPGHGGVLDRFDSVLFTAPTVYLIILLLF